MDKFILKSILFAAAILWFLPHKSFTQNKVFDLDLEFQAYPTGMIPGINVEFATGKNAGLLRLGYNWIRHGSNGVHEDERGDGYGFTLGYKRYLKADQSGYFAAIKNDIWFNSIDWKDNIGESDEIAGQTKIVVVQPTASIGYLFKLSPQLIIAPTVSFGYEVNVSTKGEPTGEGAILLVGFQIGKRFNI